MGFVSRIILIFTVLLSPATGLWATAVPTSAERRDLHIAQTKFDMTFYSESEKLLAEFCRNYTNSTLLPEAILWEAKARFEQSNYVGATELLIGHFNPRE